MPHSHSNTVRTVQELLNATFSEVESWFDRHGDLLHFHPEGGGWTVAEILEHVTLTNHFLMLVIRKGCAKALKRAARGGSIPDGESDLQLLNPIGRRGSFHWVRPDHMEPKGAVEGVRQLMREQHRECVALLAAIGRGEGSLFKVRMSVNNCGKLDLYQWLYFLAQHAQRHVQQMDANEAAWQRTRAGL